MRTSGEGVRCKTEEDVFAALGLEYKAPHQRNCYDANMIDKKDEEDNEEEEEEEQVDDNDDDDDEDEDDEE
jgi:hypothetical protein